MNRKKPQLIILFQRFFLNVNVFIFILCLLISALFWLISAFNRVSTLSITFPVQFINLPENKIISEEMPSTLLLDVKGSGFKLFFLSLRNSTKKITVDFNTLKKTNENVYAFSSTTQSSINKNLNSGVEVLRIKPEFILINENKSNMKRVRVVPDVILDFDASDASYAEIRSKPEYVTISGDSSILNTIDSVLTEKIILSAVDQNISQRVELILPEETADKVFCSAMDVEISITKDKYTEAEIQVPIRVKNLPSDFSIQLFPKKVKVKFQVGIKNYSVINDSLFEAYIDFEKLVPGRNFISIQLDKKPNFIRNVQFFPEKAEFLLKK